MDTIFKEFFFTFLSFFGFSSVPAWCDLRDNFMWKPFFTEIIFFKFYKYFLKSFLCHPNDSIFRVVCCENDNSLKKVFSRHLKFFLKFFFFYRIDTNFRIFLCENDISLKKVLLKFVSIIFLFLSCVTLWCDLQHNFMWKWYFAEEIFFSNFLSILLVFLYCVRPLIPSSA